MLLPVVLYSSGAGAEERCRLFERNTFAVEMCIHVLHNVAGSDVSGDVLGIFNVSLSSLHEWSDYNSCPGGGGGGGATGCLKKKN